MYIPKVLSTRSTIFAEGSESSDVILNVFKFKVKEFSTLTSDIFRLLLCRSME